MKSVPLKFVASINDDKLSETTPADRVLRYVDISAVRRGSVAGPIVEVPFASAPSRARRLAKSGDVAVSTVRTYLRAIAPVTEAFSDCVWSTGFAIVRPRGIDPRFLRYALVGSDFIDEVVARSVGVSYPAINPGELGAISVPVPTVAEQRAVAAFLDAETARIDATVQQRTRQAALLAERRRSVMFAAVTGKLGIEGSRRSSDVPWLSTLPEGWSEVKLTRVARLGSGHTPSRSRPDWWVDCSIPWITTGEVAQIRDDRREVLVHTRERISEIGLANSAAELRPRDTVVLCRTAASAGYSALMGTDMATSQDFATWTCGERLLPRFLLFCLRAMRSDLLGRLAMGSTHRTIYFPDIESIRIPLPPLEQQQRMLDLADRQLEILGPLEASINRQITLLQERRQALITAAVTGRLRVPDRATANAPV